MTAGISIRPWLACLVVALSICFCGMVLWPGEEPKGAATKFACLSNMKQMGMALSLYAEDTGRLPESRWMDAALPFIKVSYGDPAMVLHCPLVKPGYGYAMNAGVAGKHLTSVSKPDDLLLLFESADLAKNAMEGTPNFPDPPRHDDRVNVLFADSHGKMLTLDRARRLRSRP